MLRARRGRPVSRPRALGVRALFTAVTALGLVVIAPAAAFAARPDVNGVDGHNPPLSVVSGILIFFVLPVGLTLLIALFFLRPGSAPGAQRYRPGRDWTADATWLGVPSREHHHPALAGAETLQHGEERPADAPDVAAAPPDETIGGARGSW